MIPAPRVVEQDAVERTEALLREYTGWPAPGTHVEGAAGALVHAFAHLVDVVAERVNRVPEKNLLAFLELIGIRPIAPQTARTPLTFRLAAGATADVVVPVRTRVAAIQGPGEGEPAVFETERDLVVTAAVLEAVRTRDPGRDRYGDHGAGEAAFGAFAADRWIDHRVYIGHDSLLALAESAEVRVRFDGVSADAQWPSTLAWERWNGTAWVAHPAQVQRVAADAVEVVLSALEATPRSIVAGRAGRWLRARLGTSIPRLGGAADAAAVLRRSDVAPDAVEANGIAVAVGEPFAPFTTGPKRLLVRCDEAFSKPGAAVRLAVRVDRTRPPRPSTDLRLRWQWFDGAAFKPLGESTPAGSSGVTDTTKALSVDGTVAFTAPLGWAADPDGGRWLLIEVVTGSYGSSPPLLTGLRFGYDWQRPRTKEPRLTVKVNRSARPLDLAFANGAAVDLSKDFLPFGVQPAAGDTLYLACDDAFSPPRRAVALDVKLTTPPGAPADTAPPPASPQHQLVLRWEYFDSLTRRWTVLGESGPGRDKSLTWPLIDGTEAFTKEAAVTFAPPATMDIVDVNGVARRWLRVRIAQGDYTPSGTVVRPQPPSLKSVTATYDLTTPTVAADAVVAENDFELTAPVAAAGMLTPFTPSADSEPTLYLGFDRAFSNQAIALYFGVRDVAAGAGLRASAGAAPPVVVWEFWDGEAGDWARLETRDETLAFTRRGLVTFIGPPSLAASTQLGLTAHWLRARWTQGAYLRAPVLERVTTNTIWAHHHTTIEGEALGSSTGRRDQTLRASRAPVLEGEQVEVREADAAPWTRWTEVVDFHGSGPQDRHYVLTRASGELRFGDGRHGRIPPRGRDNVRLARYRTGGGERGNRPAGAVSRLLSSVPYVDAVVNLEPAAGGMEAEAPAALVDRGPRVLRHGGRAVVAQDFEDLALAASPGVARAIALTEPGRVGVVIVPHGDEPRPTPTAELVERVERYVRERSGATFDVWVGGPGWLRVDVEGEIVPSALELATDVENAVQARLRAFLHPLSGAASGAGWPLGRRLFRSDLRAMFELTPGVDHVRTLRISESVTERGPDPDAFLIYSGEHRIRVVGGD